MSSETGGVVQNALHMARGLVPCGFHGRECLNTFCNKDLHAQSESFFVLFPILKRTFRAQVTQE